jgi:hypothetical protein
MSWFSGIGAEGNRLMGAVKRQECVLLLSRKMARFEKLAGAAR